MDSLGGGWERGYLHHEEKSKSSDVEVSLCSEDILRAAQLKVQSSITVVGVTRTIATHLSDGL